MPEVTASIIYAIIDTCMDGVVRYVGRTQNSLSNRLRQHKYQKSPLGEWMRANPHSYNIVPIEHVPFKPWAAGTAEWKWIRHYRKLGHQLFNVFPIDQKESEA